MSKSDNITATVISQDSKTNEANPVFTQQDTAKRDIPAITVATIPLAAVDDFVKAGWLENGDKDSEFHPVLGMRGAGASLRFGLNRSIQALFDQFDERSKPVKYEDGRPVPQKNQWTILGDYRNEAVAAFEHNQITEGTFQGRMRNADMREKALEAGAEILEDMKSLYEMIFEEKWKPFDREAVNNAPTSSTMTSAMTEAYLAKYGSKKKVRKSA